MASACTNPVLYGFLNESFKKEFKNILGSVKRRRRSRLDQEMVLAPGVTTHLLDGKETNVNVNVN